MENTADVKSEEDNINTKSNLPKEDGNDQTLVSLSTETNVSTADNDILVLDCEINSEPKTKSMAVVDVNSSIKSVSVEPSNSVSFEASYSEIVEPDLSVAMASTTISETVEAKPNPNKDVLDDQLKQKTITTKNENFVVENTNNTNSNHEIVENILEKVDLNSTVSEFEDACDYFQDEYYIDATDNAKEHKRVINEENRDEEHSDNEDEQAESASEVPVPVDDDTNDPQYIPRRGRFYEHDDRMAYSTTSSEESENLSDLCDNTVRESALNKGVKKVGKPDKDINEYKPIDTSEDPSVKITEAPLSTASKKVLAISKVAADFNNSFNTPITTNNDGLTKKSSRRKSRDIDSLGKWGHDMYDEQEQTSKSKDELLSSYGYDIREETEAPRARRHHKYGRSASVKYTRSWQDTKAYTGAGSEKVRRRGQGRRNVYSPTIKNKPKSTPAEDFNSEFPTLDNENLSTVSSQKKEKVVAQQQNSTVHYQEKKITDMAQAPVTPKKSPHTTRPTKYANSSQNRNYQQELQNSTLEPSSPNKNFLNHPSNNSIGKERDGTIPVSRDPPEKNNPNLFNRKLPQHSGGNGQPNNFKQHYNNTHVGHRHNQPQSSIRGRNFQQYNNNSPQLNRDRYFTKSITVQSPNLNHHNTVGSGRIQHSGEQQYHHYNSQQYENEVHQVESQPVPMVRSSKRYSVQSRRELPDPVLNFNSMAKITQLPPVSQHQQNNSLIMQESQTTQRQQIQQPPPQIQTMPQQMQIQQPPMQLQQFHQPMPQINPHHSVVVDPNTGMVLMAADPSMYHHQLYATPQYGTTVAQGSPGNSAEDQNAAAVAAAALQMLAAQAAVYQPLPTGPAPVTSPPPGTQPIPQQPPDSFMTTYYQPQAPKQPPPRRVNLAIPIVAPSQLNQQHASRSNPSQTPPPTAASTN